MSNESTPETDTTGIRVGDILFDCPFCGKNMAIESAGAGLMVPCATCGRKVQVPIPDQETPEEPVSSAQPSAGAGEESPEALIQELDSALSMSNQQVDQLMDEREALQERRAYLEQTRTANADRLKEVTVELATMQGALDRALLLLAELRAEKPV